MAPPDPDARAKKSSAGNLDTRNQRFQVGLDLALLTTEAGPHPEANVFGQTGPNKFGGHQPPRSTYTRMGESGERDEQLMSKRRRN